MKISKNIFGNWVISIWPILLIISQKALLPFKILDFILNTKKTILNIRVVSLLLIFLALSCINLFFFSENPFSLKHFASLITFLIFVCLIISESSNSERYEWAHYMISKTNFYVLFLIHILYFLRVDLSDFRGLNFIIGNDGEVHRVFIETTSLFVISKYNVFKNKILRYFFLFLTISYIFYLNKSVFIIFLFIIHNYNFVLKSKKTILSISLATLILLLTNSTNLNSFLRADLYLSIAFKINQLESIISSFDLQTFFFGKGYGYYINDYVTDINQPYQIESQLPMLFLQLGFFLITFFIAFIYSAFKSLNQRLLIYRTTIFFIIGLINPWLLLPSWFITSCFLFDNGHNE